MAGIYIHVPFCKTRCTYCDFFTKTDMGQKNAYIEAICEEALLRRDYLINENISSIYFGGGTPSQLSIDELNQILWTLKGLFVVNDDAEITLEANPDDLTEKYVSDLLQIGFNRLSMGIQSFDDAQLSFLNRRHSAQKAIDAVTISQKAGFNNISIDLMYGLPDQTLSTWNDTLDRALSLNVQHISSYHLIYEKGTQLYKKLERGEINSTEEELSLQMFSTLIERLSRAGYQHYEISNFGKEGYFSKHNSSYWLNSKYLGLGPAAHSYNQVSRSWNISSIPQYIKGIQLGIPFVEEETLSLKERYNDFVLTGMRTIWGVNQTKLRELFGTDMLNYFKKNIHNHMLSQTVYFDTKEDTYKLNKNGIFISDTIMSDLMYID